MKTLLILAVSLTLTACGFTPQGDFARGVAREKGAQAYDEGIQNAEWFLCHAASVGSIRRHYGSDKARADAYNTLCNPQPVNPATVIN